jgi:hypothetical protein
VNSAEAYDSRRDGRFYQNIKGVIRHAVAAGHADQEFGAEGGDPRVLRRLIAAGFDGPGA